MSNPWVPKHLITNQRVVTPKRIANNNREKKLKFITNTEFLLNTINPEFDKEEINNCPNLSKSYLVPDIFDDSNTFDTIPVEPIKYDPTFVAQHVLSTNKPKLKKIKLSKDNALQDIVNLKNQPIPKLIIPCENPVSFEKRPLSVRIGTPSHSGAHSLPHSARKSNRSKSLEPMDTFLRISPIPVSSLPLYIFDDQSYDDGLFEKINCFPVKAYSLYAYERVRLEWRECIVFHYDTSTKLFFIKWDELSKPKQVYRISIRFDFDDPVVFEKRRQKAIMIRSIVEREIRLDSFLRLQFNADLKRIPPTMLSHIISKVPLHMKNHIIFPELTNDVISEFEFGQKLGYYIQEWNNPIRRKDFMLKGLEKYQLHMPFFLGCGSLPKNTLLNLPHPLHMYKMNCILKDMSEIRLFNYDYFTNSACVNYHSFFEEQSTQASIKFSQIQSTTFPKIIEIFQNISLSWDPSHIDSLIKMIDLRVTHVLENVLLSTFQDFIGLFVSNQIKFILEINQFASIRSPDFSTLETRGLRYLDQIFGIFNDSLVSVSVNIGRYNFLVLDMNRINTVYNDIKILWQNELRRSFSMVESFLESLQTILMPIPFTDIETIDDIIDTSVPIDLDNLKLFLNESHQCYTKYLDFVSILPSFGVLTLNLADLNRFIYSQDISLHRITCEYITDQIYNLVSIITSQINDLKDRCQRSPKSIEEWHQRSVLLHNLKDNFVSINQSIDAQFGYFDFLESFSYESKINISQAYLLKADLLEILKLLPIYIDQDTIDVGKLRENHHSDKQIMEKDINDLYQKILEFDNLTDLSSKHDYQSRIQEIREQYNFMNLQIQIMISRDKMIEDEPINCDTFERINNSLNIFEPLWDIACLLESQVERWMSLWFLELDPDLITKKVKEWDSALNRLLYNLENSRPNVYEIGKSIKIQLNELISHVPIVQHLCKKYLRNRHWQQISTIVGYSINRSEPLTWNWIIENGFEKSLQQISVITRNAFYEYAIEKALTEMTSEISTLSIKVSQDNNRFRIEDATPVLQMLANHQNRKMEVFVPPYTHPFIMRIQYYEDISKNLRTIIEKSVAAQSAINDIAPAMESSDTKAQQKSVVNNYENAKNQFNDIASRFSDPSQIHEIITNPKYLDVLEDLSGGLSVLKNDLKKILKKKRQDFPLFRFLSDTQLIKIISFSHKPSEFKDLFGYLYSGVSEALFDNSMKCTGFRGNDGEIFSFDYSFENTPNSVEQLFSSFGNSIFFTIRRRIFQCVKNLSDIPIRYKDWPTQIVYVGEQLRFSSRISKIFESQSGKINSIRDDFLNLRKLVYDEINNYENDPNPIQSVPVLNYITLLQKEVEILNELIDNGVVEKDSWHWQRHIRFISVGRDEEEFKVAVCCGDSSIPYGFTYTGSGPQLFLSDSIEKIYSSFFLSIENSIGTMLFGSSNVNKTRIISDFCKMIGRNAFVFPCSSNHKFKTLKRVIRTARNTSTVVLFRDIQNIKDSVLCDLYPLLLQKSKDKPIPPVFVTYSCSINQNIPSHFSLVFRPVHIEKEKIGQIIKAFLTGLGFGKNNGLICHVVSVIEDLSVTTEPRLSGVFSLKNVLRTLLQSKINPMNPNRDICMRFVSQIRGNRHASKSTKEKLMRVFELKGQGLTRENSFIFSREQRPTSQVLTNSLSLFLDTLNYKKDIVVIGSSISGKSTLISYAAKYNNAEIIKINPYTQSFDYLSGSKDNGILFNTINDSKIKKWIVFDGKCSDEWMNILSISIPDRQAIFFNDGSRLIIPQNVVFVYETDTLAYASPSVLSVCAQLVLPEYTISYEDLSEEFLNDILSDNRLVEPLSSTVVGTGVHISKFRESCMSSINKILPYVEKLVCINNSLYTYSNMFKLLKSLIISCFLNDYKHPVFSQQSMSLLIEDFEKYFLFAFIWTLYGPMLDDERLKTDESIKEAFLSLDIQLEGYNSNDSIYDYYFDPKTRKWTKWSTINNQELLYPSFSLAEMAPLSFFLNSSTLSSILVISDCLAIQGYSLFIDSHDPALTDALIQILSNTTQIATRFLPRVYRSINDDPNSDKSVRLMVEECIYDVKHHSSVSSKLPLLCIKDFDSSFSLQSELMRFSLENGYIINLKTLLHDVTKGIVNIFVDRLEIRKSINERFLRHMPRISLNKINSIKIIDGTDKMASLLCQIKFNDVILSMIKGIYEYNQKLSRFNSYHILKIIQLLGIDQLSRTSIPLSLAIGLRSIFYDSFCDSKVLDLISQGIEIGFPGFSLESTEYWKDGTIFSIANPSYFVNSIPDSFIPNIKDSKKNSSRLIEEFSFYEGYSFDRLSINNIRKDEHQFILRVVKYITTPNTNIVIDSSDSKASKRIINQACVLFGIRFESYDSGKDILSVMRELFIAAGKTSRHHVLFIDGDILSAEQTILVRSLVRSLDVFSLFPTHQLYKIVSSENDDSNDSFEEGGIESSPDFVSFVNGFLTKCSFYMHIIISLKSKTQRFHDLLEFCLPLSFNFSSDTLLSSTQGIRNEVPFVDTIPLLSEIMKKSKIDSTLFTYVFMRSYENMKSIFINHIDERYSFVNMLTDIGKMIQETIDNALSQQMRSEKEVVEISQQIEKLMEDTNLAKEKSIKEREILLSEEKELLKREEEAEFLRRESMDSLAKAKPQLMESTQELKSLSSHDISIIKSMNHPPKGVFLVVKSVVALLGYKIEDKTDEVRGDQPSYVLGRKLLSDPSFINTMMRTSFERLNDGIIKSLEVFVSDPNFRPSVVATSSTAAKSICTYVRAIVPYYHAMKIYSEKQNSLKECEEGLSSLRMQHETALNRLNESMNSVNEIENKLIQLKTNKDSIEKKLTEQKSSVAHYKSTMSALIRFFDRWESELGSLNVEKESHYLNSLFISCYLLLCSVTPSTEREKYFFELSSIFKVFNYNKYSSRNDFTKHITGTITSLCPKSIYSNYSAPHFVENSLIFRLFSSSWFFVIDNDGTFSQDIKNIYDKKITYTSYISKKFSNDLKNSIMGNDVLVVYDFDTQMTISTLYQVFNSKLSGNSVLIDGSNILVSADFQIIFLVTQFPQHHFFDSLFVECTVSDEEIIQKSISIIVSGIYPDMAHEAEELVRTNQESRIEIFKIENEMGQIVMNSAQGFLDNEKLLAKFISLGKNFDKIEFEIQKRETRLNEILQRIQSYDKEFSKLVTIYRQIKPNEGIPRFIEELINALENTRNEMRETRFQKVCSNLGERLKQIHMASYGISCPEPFHNDYPMLISDLIGKSNCRRPIFASSSPSLLKWALSKSNTVISPLSDYSVSLLTAIKKGYIVIMFCVNQSLLPSVLSAISLIRSESYVSSDFRLIVYCEFDFYSQGGLLQYCDFYDMRRIRTIKQIISISLSSFPITFYDSTSLHKWRRLVLLVHIFDSLLNEKILEIGGSRFNERFVDIILSYLSKNLNDTRTIIEGGLFIVSSLYSSENSFFKDDVTNLWRTIITDTNISNSSITLFGKYSLPFTYDPSDIKSLVSIFPSSIINLFAKKAELQNDNSDEPIPQVNNRWYIQSEVEDIKLLISKGPKNRSIINFNIRSISYDCIHLPGIIDIERFFRSVLPIGKNLVLSDTGNLLVSGLKINKGKYEDGFIIQDDNKDDMPPRYLRPADPTESSLVKLPLIHKGYKVVSLRIASKSGNPGSSFFSIE